MKSFQLEKTSDTKQEATSAGALLIILGIVVAFVWMPLAGIVLGLLGIVALLAGKYASN